MQDQALIELGRQLKTRGYRFTTVTPITHARINKRSENLIGISLEQILGWNRPFHKKNLPNEIATLLESADVLKVEGNLLKSTVRFSNIGNLLFLHSSFPTLEVNAVFFGPDTYRFARMLHHAINDRPTNTYARIIDIGCGSGAGGLYAQSLLAHNCDTQLILGDINPAALRYARINALLNGFSETQIVYSDVLGGISGSADLIISNPPYLADPAARTYRHGGGKFGSALSIRIVSEALPRLSPSGRLLLYTGAPIVDGVDKFLEAISPLLHRSNCSFVYEELDPDVFGEELDEPPYAHVDRLAAVALTITAPERENKYAQ